MYSDNYKWYDGSIISVEKLHELVSDHYITHIYLRNTVFGKDIGSEDPEREFSEWELRYQDGKKIHVYV